MSVYNANGIELYTVYSSDGTELPQCYDKDGTALLSPTFDDATTITDIYSMQTSDSPQGGCIDDDGNIYVCFYHAGIFVKYNVNTNIKTETEFTPDAYGHANGMAYNPNDGHLYIAAMKDTGEVYELDKSFNLVNTHYAKDGNNTAFNCWNIAYDRTSDRFITISGNKLYFMDDSFEYITHVPCVEAELWPYTAQDIETDGEFIYAVGWNINTIAVTNMDGTLKQYVSNTAFSGEPESMCYDWINGNFYIEGRASGLVIRQAVFKHG